MTLGLQFYAGPTSAAAPVASKSSGGRRLPRYFSVRNSAGFKILVFPFLIYVAWMVVALGLMVVDGRKRIVAEIESSGALAHALADSALTEIQSGRSAPEFLAELRQKLPHARHVRFFVASSWSDAALGDVLVSARNGSNAPDWFCDLIAPPQKLEVMALAISGSPAGFLFISPDPSDEIEEVWEGFVGLASIFSLAFLANTLAVAWLFVHLMRPLRSVAAGLESLERGHLAVSLSVDQPREILPIIGKFNTLARSLARSDNENRELRQQLIAFRESERKHIAHELHDELGPCLFSIRAEASCLATAVPREAPFAEVVVARARSIGDLVDAVQRINRNLLETLRPEAIAQRGLAAALHDLVDGWQDRNPDTHLSLDVMETDVAGLGEAVALAVYRIVQEGVTNIARHARADFAEVVVRSEPCSGAASTVNSKILRVIVRDNGRGLPDEIRQGLGLSGIQARARELGGSAVFSGPPGTGLTVNVMLPLDGPQR